MSLKRIVNEPSLYKALQEELDERILLEQRRLETATSTDAMFRHQGYLRCLRDLKQLREKVNGPEKNEA